MASCRQAAVRQGFLCILCPLPVSSRQATRTLVTRTFQKLTRLAQSIQPDSACPWSIVAWPSRIEPPKDEAEESLIENPGEQIRTITNLPLHLQVLMQ